MPGASGGSAGGTVTPRTVKETATAWLLDTPTLQHLLQQWPGGVCPVRAVVDDHVENRSIYNTGSVPGGSSQIAGRVRQPARSCRCGASLLRRVREVSLRTLTGIRASLHETARAEMTVPEVVDRPSRSAGRADPARDRRLVTGLPGARVGLGSFFWRTGRPGCIVWPAPGFVRGPDALRRAGIVASGMAKDVTDGFVLGASRKGGLSCFF